jgi:ferric-dicitrate binding protein FerR (iron transport regulator)
MIDKKELERYLKGQLSSSELETFRQYLELEKVEALEQLLLQDWETNPAQQGSIDPALSQEILHNIKQQIGQDQPVRKLIPRRSWQIAAGFALLTVLVATLWNLAQAQPTLVTNNTKEIKKVTLEDGSVVWLNRKTELSYLMTSKKRSLTLKGEAFFEVTKNPQRPFVVQTGALSTKVLGTSFNVEAFPEDERVEVSLVTGKVVIEVKQGNNLQQLLLIPGEQVEYQPKKGKMTKSRFQTADETAWREGHLVLQKTPLNLALNQISRLYSTELHFDTLKLKKCIVTSTFNRADPIDEVLSVILFSSNLSYQKKGAIYTIKGIGCN